MNDQLTQLVSAVSESSKYKGVSLEFIAAVGEQELRKHPKLKDAVKATKNKLHQVGGAFLDFKPAYAQWLRELKDVCFSGANDAVRKTCIKIMTHHASTRERLPVLDQFYDTLLSDVLPIQSVLDIACGLNPLSIPWMPLVDGADYYAIDVYENMIAFLDECLPCLGVQGHAMVCDVNRLARFPKVDVALILKTIPCLERLDKAAGSRLLEMINANYLFVSFPGFSLCGRSKGMMAGYEASFHQLVSGKNWRISKYKFATEIVFKVVKH
ncbi:MAG: 16S rRNA methyltransferase [Acidobacteria bacterium]|nr:16S rRNA methyltransferase [Acidobacteriota bacterium]